jgi:hypothetical protein
MDSRVRRFHRMWNAGHRGWMPRGKQAGGRQGRNYNAQDAQGQEQALASHCQDADTEVDIARVRRKRIRAMSFWGGRMAAQEVRRG